MNESENSWNVETLLQTLEQQQDELDEKEKTIQQLSSMKQELESTVQKQSKKIAEQSETIKSLNEQIGTLHESDEKLRIAQEMTENAETRLEEAKTAKVIADTAISNADREREKAERKRREYQKLCDDQKAEIDKAAEAWRKNRTSSGCAGSDPNSADGRSVEYPDWMPNQYFAALTNMRSVGVMGDERTYDYAIALRAVRTIDFMTAEAANIPFEVLQTVMSRIINEVRGVNRVFDDLTSKPPGTIELE